MPDAVPNYLRTGSDGKVQAVFPGGVQVDASTPLQPEPALAKNAITWTRATDGALVAQVAGSWDDGLPTPQQELVMNTFAHDNPANVSFLNVFSGNGGVGGVGAQAALVNRLIIDSNAQSGFAQWARGTQDTKIAIGVSTFAVSLGWSTYSFPWGFTWTSVRGFVYAIGISVGASITSSELLGFNTVNGFVNINSAAAQNVAVYWLAWGI